MSTRAFWLAYLSSLALGSGWLLVADWPPLAWALYPLFALVVLFSVDAVLNVRRDWARFRDHGVKPGETFEGETS